MCRAGGRRCKGSHASSRATQTARKQRSRANQALRRAKATGDPDAIAAAQQRLDQANANFQAAKENLVSHNDNHDTADHSGDVTTPKPAPITGELSDKPLLANTWGDIGNNSPVHYHDDGPVGTAVKYMGADARMDVDGEPLANVVGRIATGVVRRQTKTQQAVDELKQLHDRLPEDSRAKRCLSSALRDMDGPDTPVPPVPPGTPEVMKDLVRKLHAVPMVRREPEKELQPLLDICTRAAAADERTALLMDDEVKRLRNKRHESLGDSGKFEIDDAVNDAVMTMKEQRLQQREQARQRRAAAESSAQSGDVTKQSAADVLREMREDMKQREQAARSTKPDNGPQATNAAPGPSVVGVQGSVITGQTGDVTAPRTTGVHSGQPTHVTITNTATSVGIQGQNIRGATVVDGQVVDHGTTSTSGGVQNYVGGAMRGKQFGTINGGLTVHAGGRVTTGSNQHGQGDVTPAARRVQEQAKRVQQEAKQRAARVREQAKQAREANPGQGSNVHTGPRDHGTGPVTITDGNGNTVIQAGDVRGGVWVNGKRVD